MTDRELMQQAADKLSIAVGYPGLRFYHEDMRAVLNALRERLAQPEPEPLTDEEIDAEWLELDGEASALFKRVIRRFARAIEAKLKEKNT